MNHGTREQKVNAVKQRALVVSHNTARCSQPLNDKNAFNPWFHSKAEAVFSLNYINQKTTLFCKQALNANRRWLWGEKNEAKLKVFQWLLIMNE